MTIRQQDIEEHPFDSAFTCVYHSSTRLTDRSIYTLTGTLWKHQGTGVLEGSIRLLHLSGAHGSLPLYQRPFSSSKAFTDHLSRIREQLAAVPCLGTRSIL